ncbi:hypothetical protein VNO77_41603 [Canavalia gladiata]|uniref:Uncharacterized protein n=1 Tax=Canavalia gladiata TaxID=3824 RepID=A0AAN9K1B7_CANGL
MLRSVRRLGKELDSFSAVAEMHQMYIRCSAGYLLEALQQSPQFNHHPLMRCCALFTNLPRHFLNQVQAFWVQLHKEVRIGELPRFGTGSYYPKKVRSGGFLVQASHNSLNPLRVSHVKVGICQSVFEVPRKRNIVACSVGYRALYLDSYNAYKRSSSNHQV